MPDRDPLLSLASDVRIACQHVSRRVRFDNCHEIPPHHFSVLAKLAMGVANTAGELARIEEVSAPSMTRTVNSLVEAGLAPEDAFDTYSAMSVHVRGSVVLQRLREKNLAAEDWFKAARGCRSGDDYVVDRYEFREDFIIESYGIEVSYKIDDRYYVG